MLILSSCYTFAEPTFWYGYKDNILGVGDLSPEKPCYGQSNGFVVHKGIITKSTIYRDWVAIHVDLDKNYVETLGLTKRIFEIPHSYIMEMRNEDYEKFFKFIKSKETMVFTGHVCGATERSGINLDSIFKYSSIIKK